MPRLSTGMRNQFLSGGSLKAALDGGSIKLYSGPVPADADAALGAAVLLVDVKNGGSGINFDTAAAGGTLSKAPAETWSSNAVASGTPTFARHVAASDDGSASTSQKRLQLTVGLAGADVNLASMSIVSGSPVPINNYNVTMPAA